LPNVPGFLTITGLIGKDTVWPWLVYLYNYAWFVGFFISGLTYLLMMQGKTSAIAEPLNLEKGDLNVSIN
jgi:nucleobase:cation symporter-1, NCS1 family